MTVSIVNLAESEITQERNLNEVLFRLGRPVDWLWATQSGYWELNLSPLEEQQSLLTGHPSGLFYSALVLETDTWALCMLVLGEHSTAEVHSLPWSFWRSEQWTRITREEWEYSTHAADPGRLLIMTAFPRSAIQVKDHSRIFKVSLCTFMYTSEI